MRVDAHQHFWRYEPAQYPWIQSDWPLRRDFLPPDLEPILGQAGLDACVAVQARQSLEETRWLLELADRHSFIKGVVGWVDLRSADLERQLEEFAVRPKFAGVRHVVQDEPDERFLLQPDFRRGIGGLARYSLVYDILIYPRQLPAAVELAREFPEQPFVLDHMAKPVIRDSLLSPWREQIQDLAKSPNVTCKVSGLITEAHWTKWRKADFRPCLDVVIEAFGPKRLMFGSDWPVCLLAGSYAQVCELVTDYFAPLSEPDREAILGGTAARVYRLKR